MLFDKVCEHLNLLEKDYFGITYRDVENQKVKINIWFVFIMLLMDRLEVRQIDLLNMVNVIPNGNMSLKSCLFLFHQTVVLFLPSLSLLFRIG